MIKLLKYLHHKKTFTRQARWDENCGTFVVDSILEKWINRHYKIRWATRFPVYRPKGKVTMYSRICIGGLK